MPSLTTVPGFAGELVEPGDESYDRHREIWNGIFDRRPALIARCSSPSDVVAAIRHGRERDLDIAVKSGGHSVLGLAVPDGGLMIDLTPMGEVRVDPMARRAVVGGGALLRSLDAATAPHGLATTAGKSRTRASAGSRSAAEWAGSRVAAGSPATTSSRTRS